MARPTSLHLAHAIDQNREVKLRLVSKGAGYKSEDGQCSASRLQWLLAQAPPAATPPKHPQQPVLVLLRCLDMGLTVWYTKGAVGRPRHLSGACQRWTWSPGERVRTEASEDVVSDVVGEAPHQHAVHEALTCLELSGCVM